MKTPLLPALLLALSVPATAASSDTDFTGALAAVQAQARAGAAESREAARRGPAHQDAVEAGGKLYFLDGGRVFETVPGSGVAAHLSGSSNVIALVAYRDALIALRDNGRIYVWTPRGRWVDIGSNTSRILVAGDDLLALTRSGQVWTYQGAPGPVRISYILIPMRVGDVTIMQMYPVVNGHRVAFTDTGVHDVARLDPDGQGGARIVRRDGSASPYVRGR